MAEKSVLDLYRNEFESQKEEHYFHYTLDGFSTLSTSEFFDSTAGLAVGLEKLGIGRGDRVMLLTDNRPEWPLLDPPRPEPLVALIERLMRAGRRALKRRPN